MKLKSFKKGVHPFEGKALAEACAIQSIAAADTLVYPLTQHIGAPAKPVVSAGERVRKGQLLAEAGGVISAPIHASVSGTVKAVEKRLTIEGVQQDCIVVENDGLDEAVDGFGLERDAAALSAEEIRDIIKNAGIVGLGGAAFPTSVKLTPKNAPDIDTIVVNGCECEPYLTADHRLMVEKSDCIVQGIRLVLKLFPKAKAVIGIEVNKKEDIEILTKQTAGDANISVSSLKTKYPQGGERQLIYAVTGRRLNSKMLPADKGCIVVNVATCYAIYEAVCRNMPLVHKVVTVTGEGANRPCNLDVPVGMSYKEVLDAAGGAAAETVKFIAGGPMMGSALTTLDIPVTKTASSLVAFCEDDVAALKTSACIHCGRCVSACPENLIPQMMVKAVKAEQIDEFERLGGMECIGCGCCSYVCPAKIPLTQHFRYAKAAVVAKKKKG